VDWQTAAVAIAASGFTASVAIWSISRSQQQFVSQRWWEKKAETYSTIVE
jgi:hypothetical protein